jgi:hypothetical protein
MNFSFLRINKNNAENTAKDEDKNNPIALQVFMVTIFSVNPFSVSIIIILSTF